MTGMNGYKAFYKGRTTDVWARSSYGARLEAEGFFKAKRAHDVTVVLCQVWDEATGTHRQASVDTASL